MEIYGTFLKYIQRNEKTGNSVFLISVDEEYGKFSKKCKGVSGYYNYLTPLKIIGEEDRGYFMISEIIPCGYNADVMEDFLTSGLFDGVGEKTAKKIVELYGADLFSVKDYAGKEFSNVLSVLKTINEFSFFMKYCRKYEIDYKCARKVYGFFGAGALEKIKKNPYLLLKDGINFKVCEKIANDNKIEFFEKNRVDGIIYWILCVNKSRGNTRILYTELLKKIRFLEETLKSSPINEILILAQLIENDDFYITPDEKWVYLNEDYQIEENIVKEIKRIKLSKVDLNCQINIEKIEKFLGIKYNNDQIAAFDCLKNSDISIITGGPGTGKTSILRGIISTYRKNNPEKNIMLLSPTGCAAKRLSQATGCFATTIHKGLEILPFMSKDLFENIYMTKTVDADLIIVDEASMLDEKIFLLLLHSIKNESKLILVGDVDQLPSVGQGNVLNDLIESKRISVYRLKEIYRQENSIIIDNARKALCGRGDFFVNNNFCVCKYNNDDDIFKKVLDNVVRFESLKRDYKVFSPIKNKKYALSTTNLNNRIEKSVNLEDGVLYRETVLYGDYLFKKSDKVMFITNNYKEGYYNGQEGIITEIQKEKNKIYITILSEGEEIVIKNDNLSDIVLNYAITAHKSQGNEYESVIIVIPDEPLNMLQRKLLYVEITRAKKNVLVISKNDALKINLSNNSEVSRETGLKDLLDFA